ncbi:MAG: TldD/PmbA family protein [Phormidesmis sp.]
MTLQTTDTEQTNDSFSSTSTSTQQAASGSRHYQKTFQQLVDAINRNIGRNIGNQSDLHFTLTLTGEDSQFTRFSQVKVRQTGQVCAGQLRLTLITSKEITSEEISSKDGSHESKRDSVPSQAADANKAHRTATITLPFTGNFTADWKVIQPALTQLQAELPLLPIDPYAVLPTKTQATSQASHQSQNHTNEVHTGNLLEASAVAEALLNPIRSSAEETSPALDFSGLYAGGLSYRAYADSVGKRHWFETPSFTLDYSLFGSRLQQAVKGTVAGKHWNPEKYEQDIAAVAAQLKLLSRPAKAVPRGSYRTYLAPAAVADIIDTIIWGGLGEASLRQGNSAFSKLEQGEAVLSEQFSLEEDFQRIGIPRFNSSGEIAPTRLPLIQKGQWASSLINGRSAKEYGKASNGANEEEVMRAPTVAPGTLKEKDILAELDTGLYISNLHYLNWSDLNAGRITGMTRYACFWVEAGEIVAPIENLRFDDDLYRFLGEGLIALTDQQTFLPAVGTYDRRSLGGMWVPGMLIDQFRYTL